MSDISLIWRYRSVLHLISFYEERLCGYPRQKKRKSDNFFHLTKITDTILTITNIFVLCQVKVKLNHSSAVDLLWGLLVDFPPHALLTRQGLLQALLDIMVRSQISPRTQHTVHSSLN